MKQNIFKYYKLGLVAVMPFILLAGCNSGTTGSVNPSASQNNMLSKAAMNNSLSTNAIIAHIQKLKDTSSIGINYTLDGEPLNTQTDNWSDMGWHLLTLTVSSAPPKQAPIPVQGVWATVGSPENPAIDGEVVTVQDINCVGAAFSQVGQTCSAYVKVSYDHTTYPTAQPIVTVNLAPNNYDNLPIMIQPHDWIKPQTTVGIYRPIHSFEAQYYSGSTVKANPTQYRMLLMQNGSLASISVNNLTPPSNPIFTALHRTTSTNSDPIYGKWSECALTANSGLNQVATLPNLNSSCILVYQAASTSSAPTQTTDLTVGTSASTTFPYNATSYTLDATYSGIAINGVSWTNETIPNGSSNYQFLSTDGNGHFVALGYNGNAAYSADGVNWQSVTMPNINGSTWNSLVYGNGKFVAMSYSVQAAYSVDGINWQFANQLPVSPSQITGISNVTYGNGVYISGGCYYIPGNRMSCSPFEIYSTDGINWSLQNNSSLPGGGHYAFGAGKFLMDRYATFGGGYSGYSINGTTGWQGSPSIPNESENVTFLNGMCIALSYNEAYSTDCINWSETNTPFSFLGVGYGNNLYVAVGGSNYAYSFNGINWTQDQDSGNYSAISYDNISNSFIAPGGNGKISYSEGSLSQFVIN